MTPQMGLFVAVSGMVRYPGTRLRAGGLIRSSVTAIQPLAHCLRATGRAGPRGRCHRSSCSSIPEEIGGGEGICFGSGDGMQRAFVVLADSIPMQNEWLAETTGFRKKRCLLSLT
jgi:hypothetical protein